jgi:hypothetical protein
MSLHPYTQIEIIRSFQEEKRRELLKLREGQVAKEKRPPLVRRLLYASGSALVAAGNILKQRAEPALQ